MKSVLMRGAESYFHASSVGGARESSLKVEIIDEKDSLYGENFLRYKDLQNEIKKSSPEEKKALIKEKEELERTLAESLDASLSEKGGALTYCEDIHTAFCGIPGKNAQEKQSALKKFVTKEISVTEETVDWADSVNAILEERFELDGLNVNKVKVGGEWIKIQSDRGVPVTSFISARPVSLGIVDVDGQKVAMVVKGFNAFTEIDTKRFVESQGKATKPEIINDAEIVDPKSSQETAIVLSSHRNSEILDGEIINSEIPLTGQLSVEDFYAAVQQELESRHAEDSKESPSTALELVQERHSQTFEDVQDFITEALNQDPIRVSRMQVAAARQKLARMEAGGEVFAMGNKILDQREITIPKLEAGYQDAIDQLKETLREQFQGDLLTQGLQLLYAREIDHMRNASRSEVESSRTGVEKAFAQAGGIYEDAKKAKGWKKWRNIGIKAVLGVGGGFAAEAGLAKWQEKSVQKEMQELEAFLSTYGDSQEDLIKMQSYIASIDARYQLTGEIPAEHTDLYNVLVERYSTTLAQMETLPADESIDESRFVYSMRSLHNQKQAALEKSMRAGNQRKVAFVAGALVSKFGIGAVFSGLNNSAEAVEFVSSVPVEEGVINATESMQVAATAVETFAEFDSLTPGETVWENISGAMQELGMEVNDETVRQVVESYFETDAGKEAMLELASQTEGGSSLLAEWGIDNASQLTSDQMMELSHYMAEGELEGLVDFVQDSAQGVEEVVSSGVENITVEVPELPETNIIDPTESFRGEFIEQAESLGLESDTAQELYQDFLQTEDAQRMAYNEASEFPEGRSLLNEWNITDPSQLDVDQIQEVFETSPDTEIHTDIAEAIQDMLPDIAETMEFISFDQFSEEYGSLFADLLQNQSELIVTPNSRLFPAFEAQLDNILPNIDLPPNYAKQCFEQSFSTRKGAESLVSVLRESHTLESQKLIESLSRQGLIDANGGAKVLAQKIGKDSAFFWREIYTVIPKGVAPEHMLQHAAQATKIMTKSTT